MIKTRKEKMLEARIARLEKLFKGIRYIKNERNIADINLELGEEVEDWFWNHCTEDGFDSRREWVETLMALANHDDDITVSMCNDEIGDGDSWDEVAGILAECASEMIRDSQLNEDDIWDDDEWNDEEDDDWDEEDEYDESMKRRISHRRNEARKSVRKRHI